MKCFYGLGNPLTAYLSLAVFTVSHGMMLYAGHLGSGGLVFSICWIMATAAVLGLRQIFPETDTAKAAAVIMVSAVLVRIPYLFFFSEGDDIFRYIWEGMIQGHGFSPFVHAPDSLLLAHLRDDLWTGINNKSVPAIYPPLAQLLFRSLDGIHHSPLIFKAFFTLCDLVTTAILLCWSFQKGLDPRHVLLFSLSPVSIIFSSGEGHLDAFMVTALAGGLFLYDTGRFRGGFFLMGCAIMLKLTPVILIPFLITRRNIRHIWAAALPCLSLFLFKGNFLAVLIHFAGSTWYNGPLTWILRKIHMGSAPVLAASVFGLWAMREFFFGADRLRSVHILMGLFFLCTMVLHPWYLLWGVMLLPFYRSPTLMVFTASVCFTFTVNDVCRRTGIWAVPDLPLFLEYLPVILVFLYTLALRHKTGRNVFPPPHKTAVIIPTLNEEKNLAQCLLSIESQTLLPDEIWIADGGSIDATLETAAAFPGVKVVSSPPGRGIQIAGAVSVSQADMILICHADVIMQPAMLEHAKKALAENSVAAGGAFRIIYDHQSPGATFLICLNFLKTALLGISFGDQCQFFRKAALPGGFPALRLMEDVELSFRIREAGAFCFLYSGPIVSFRRWKLKGIAPNFFNIFFLMTRFIISRRLGTLSVDAEEFYRPYYGRKHVRSKL